jgi:hypothetical protein
VRRRYAERGLSVVGIHSPEFEAEKVRASVESEVRKKGLDFPHLLDDDHAYWDALGNQYWPALYLVDRCGRIRGHAFGEVHSGEESGRRLEAQIEDLLRETAAGCDAASGRD